MDKSVSKKLALLSKLQAIDSQLDDIKKLQGTLPDELKDLEDTQVGYQTRLSRTEEELKESKHEIDKQREAIKRSEVLIQKYIEQEKNVRNNREFDAIRKETELQKLDIKLAERAIKNGYESIDRKESAIEETKKLQEEIAHQVAGKKEELEQINAESKEQNVNLGKEREELIKELDPHLIIAYEKMRKNVRNGLVVVTVRREACGGCFNAVPPQQQVEIKEKKKLMVCEHCGRIFADVEQPIVKEKKKRVTKRTKATTKKKETPSDG